MTAEFKNAGLRLKTARMAAGFKSAKEFCEKFTIPSSTYSLHETGGRSLKLKTAEKYAKLLGINVAWLLTGTGSPYLNSESDNKNPVSTIEFMELLKYHGNKKIQESLECKNEILNNVHPSLFCKIIIGIMESLHDLNFSLNEDEISKKAIEIYKDISTSSNQFEDQLTMVALSITIFKRQIQEFIDHNIKKVVNK